MDMGRDNFVGHGAVLGKSPQHKGYRGEPTSLRIGDGNVFREHVTVHRGTVAGRRRDPDRRPQHVHDRQPRRPRLPGRQRLHAGQRGARRRPRRAARRLHPLGPRGGAAAGADRPAGDARRPRLDHQGHPAVRAPAGVQLRLGAEHRRPPPGRHLGRVDRRPPRGVPHPLQGRPDAERRARADRGRPGPGPRGRRVHHVHPRIDHRHQPARSNERQNRTF